MRMPYRMSAVTPSTRLPDVIRALRHPWLRLSQQQHPLLLSIGVACQTLGARAAGPQHLSMNVVCSILQIRRPCHTEQNGEAIFAVTITFTIVTIHRTCITFIKDIG